MTEYKQIIIIDILKSKNAIDFKLIWSKISCTPSADLADVSAKIQFFWEEKDCATSNGTCHIK